VQTVAHGRSQKFAVAAGKLRGSRVPAARSARNNP
jgi:hypothetical protein